MIHDALQPDRNIPGVFSASIKRELDDDPENCGR